MKKKIAVRADGGTKNGLGHIMRTMALAEELKKDFDVFYICSNKNEFDAGRKTILEKGYSVYSDTEYKTGNLLIIDMYGIDENYITMYRKQFDKIMYIDDLHELKYYDCDILLNRNIGSEDIKYNIRKGGQILLGGKYCILRKEFYRSCKTFNESVKEVLITLGGSDVTNSSAELAKVISNFGFNVSIAIGAGFSYENKKRLEDIKSDKIKLYYEPVMADMYEKCDIAVSALGGSLFELCALGVPFVGVTAADNQMETAYIGEKKGLFKYGGDLRNYNKTDFIKAFNFIAYNAEERKKVYDSQRKAVDINGTKNIVNCIYAILI